MVVLSGQCCNEITVKNSCWYWKLPATSSDLSNTCPPGSSSLLTSVTLLHQLVSNISNFQNHDWEMFSVNSACKVSETFWQCIRLCFHLFGAQVTCTQIVPFYFLKLYLVIFNGCRELLTTKLLNSVKITTTEKSGQKFEEHTEVIGVWDEPCFAEGFVHYWWQSGVFPQPVLSNLYQFIAKLHCFINSPSSTYDNNICYINTFIFTPITEHWCCTGDLP